MILSNYTLPGYLFLQAFAQYSKKNNTIFFSNFEDSDK